MKNSDTQKPLFETNIVQDIRFLHEQNGIPEKKLKQALVSVLKNTVQRAYLVRVEYIATGTNAVAICLSETEKQESLVKSIAKIFSSMFGSSQNLDIIFLNEKQEKELTNICGPFFEETSRASHNTQHTTQS